MIYHLKAYLSAFPEFVSHKEFKTWEEVVVEFGREMAEVNYGHDGMHCPNKNEGIEFDSLVDGNNGQGKKFEFGVQEFSVTDDNGNPIIKEWDITVDYQMTRTHTFRVKGMSEAEALKKIDQLVADHDFNEDSVTNSDWEIGCYEQVEESVSL